VFLAHPKDWVFLEMDGRWRRGCRAEQAKADSAQEKRTAGAMAQLAKRKAAAKTGGDVVDK
jgi:hypothetical protein